MLGVYLQPSEPAAVGKEVEGNNKWNIKIRTIVAKCGEVALRFIEC